MRPSPIPREVGTCAARDVAGGSGRATVVRPAGGRQGHEGGPRIPGTGRVQGAGCTGARPGACSLRPGDGRVRARTGGRRGAEGAQRPRRRHGARRVVRRCVPAGFVPEIGRADGLRRRVRPRRARHGAGEAGVLRARRPRRPPRRGLAAPAYARLPCPRARMASQEVSEHVEHVDDPLLTAHRTLPLVSERTGRHAQGRVAVQSSLPLGIERAVSVRSGSSGSASGTFRVEWQCVSHCHSVVSVLSGAPYTATRRRACWAAHRTLPLGGERTGRHVQGRVAVRLTLPLGSERAERRAVHCHSASSVPHRHDQGRVAVRPVRPEASGGAGRDGLRTRSRHTDWRVAQLDKCARTTPPARPAGGSRRGPPAAAGG